MGLPNELLESYFLPKLTLQEIANLAYVNSFYWDSILGKRVRELYKIGIRADRPLAENMKPLLQTPSSYLKKKQFGLEQLRRLIQQEADENSLVALNYRVSDKLIRAAEALSILWMTTKPAEKQRRFEEMLELADISGGTLAEGFMTSLFMDSMFRGRRFAMSSPVINSMGDVGQFIAMEYAKWKEITVNFKGYDFSSITSELFFLYVLQGGFMGSTSLDDAGFDLLIERGFSTETLEKVLDLAGSKDMVGGATSEELSNLDRSTKRKTSLGLLRRFLA